jgi:hypothetical protein
MKKEDILKILEEADELLGNYSDAQLTAQLTINTNRTLESCSKGGKIGGPIGGKISKDNKLGFHALSHEQKSEIGKKVGKEIGPRSYKEGFGIFGISKEETIKNAIAGGKAAIKSPNHINYKRLTCPHCSKEGGYQVMKRWHMDNCKSKK